MLSCITLGKHFFVKMAMTKLLALLDMASSGGVTKNYFFNLF